MKKIFLRKSYRLDSFVFPILTWPFFETILFWGFSIVKNFFSLSSLRSRSPRPGLDGPLGKLQLIMRRGRWKNQWYICCSREDLPGKEHLFSWALSKGGCFFWAVSPEKWKNDLEPSLRGLTSSSAEGLSNWRGIDFNMCRWDMLSQKFQPKFKTKV